MTEQNPEPNPHEQELTAGMAPLSMLSPALVQMLPGMAQAPDGSKMVLLRFETQVGSFVFFASPSAAKKFALDIADVAAKAENSLIVPGMGMQL